MTLEWFTYVPGATLVNGEHAKTIDRGYERTLDYARDMLARPHDQASANMLWAECTEVAELLAKISEEDGDTRFLASCLRVMILDAVNRETGLCTSESVATQEDAISGAETEADAEAAMAGPESHASEEADRG